MRCLGYYGDSILCPCYNYYLIPKYSFLFDSDDTFLHSVNKLINLISIESYFLEVCAFGTLTTFTQVFPKYIIGLNYLTPPLDDLLPGKL